jgi:hypothetical protein
MTTSLELYKRSREKAAKHRLVVRFIIHRKTYRYPTGHTLTVREWQQEQINGYPNTSDAISVEDKVKVIVTELMPGFDFEKFTIKMKQPLIPQDAITRHWVNFIEHRDELYLNQQIAFRTREIDDNLKKKLDVFLERHPELNNLHVWTSATLTTFQQFMVKTVSVTTAKIYLEAYRTFFNWARDHEIIYKDIWRKYRIPKTGSSWFPYSYKEVAIIFALKPANEPQRFALRWTKLLLFSGGADPKDFSEMKWWQVQSEAIQFMRVKSAKRSRAGKKLLYLSSAVRDQFEEIKAERGTQDDYLLPVYKADASEEKNLEAHKYFMRKINSNMRVMLTNKEGKLLLDFKIKRIRPTAATIANASTKDLDFVSKMLMHSNLQQTSTYMGVLPNDEMKDNQTKYEQAIADVSM